MRLDHAWLRLRTMALLMLGRSAAALVVLDQMLSRWPDDAYALASRGHLRASLGIPDGAIADLQRLVQVHPDRAAADWFNLGFVLEEAGRLDDAEAAFRRAVAINPELDRAWYGLGLVLIRQQRLDEAVDALERNTELQPMSPYGWYQLARVHVDRSQPEQARKIIRHLKRFEPKVADQLSRETGLAP